ncbi:unnamed protein product [Gadus morhua 'NCC']
MWGCMALSSFLSVRISEHSYSTPCLCRSSHHRARHSLHPGISFTQVALLSPAGVLASRGFPPVPEHF